MKATLCEYNNGVLLMIMHHFAYILKTDNNKYNIQQEEL